MPPGSNDSYMAYRSRGDGAGLVKQKVKVRSIVAHAVVLKVDRWAHVVFDGRCGEPKSWDPDS